MFVCDDLRIFFNGIYQENATTLDHLVPFVPYFT